MTTLNPSPTPADIAKFLPADAFDVTVVDFVARWKTPNKHAANGVHASVRFLGGAFLAALRDAAPELKSWKIESWGGTAAVTIWDERPALFSDDAKLFATVSGYGANAYSKAEIRTWATAKMGRTTSNTASINVSLSRPIEAIAQDVTRRALAGLSAEVDALKAKIAKEDADAAAVAKKAASLGKRYPNLKISVDDYKIRVASKYGAGISIDAYAYQDSQTGIWRLITQHSRELSVSDIDKPYGRAFLKLCNAS